MPSRNPWHVAVAGGLAWVAAVLVRWQHLPVTSALLDATGPFLSAARSTALPPPHAAIYGGALAWPHRLVLAGAGSLWDAVAAVHALHALVAPLAVWALFRMGARPLACGVGGLVLAFEPGLIDTAASGAEGYLAPVWLGAVVVWGCRPRTAALAPIAFGLAVANHPLAGVCAPLLLPALKHRPARWSTLAVAVALVPQGARLLGQESGGGEPALGVAWVALQAWGGQAGWAGLVVALGPFVGLVHPRTRPLAVCTATALVLLMGSGSALGYLRDHHLRLLSVPAVACWAGAPWGLVLLAVALVRPPPDPVAAAHQARRPGTLGLESRIAQVLASEPGTFVVDAAWFSGAPAAEPGALMLDLALRGVDPGRLDVGGDVLLLVTAERKHLARLTPGGLEGVWRDDRAWLLRGSADEVRLWTAGVCDNGALPRPRIGGAWDGLAVLHPDRTAEQTRAWNGCQTL